MASLPSAFASKKELKKEEEARKQRQKNVKKALDEAKNNAILEAELKNNKKTRMRTSEDVINRIKWDPTLEKRKSDFGIGYEDRFLGVVDTPFDEFNWEDVPLHRIQYFRFNKRVVWDKRKRLDHFFGSCAPEEFRQNVTVFDVIIEEDSGVDTSLISSPQGAGKSKRNRSKSLNNKKGERLELGHGLDHNLDPEFQMFSEIFDKETTPSSHGKHSNPKQSTSGGALSKSLPKKSFLDWLDDDDGYDDLDGESEEDYAGEVETQHFDIDDNEEYNEDEEYYEGEGEGEEYYDEEYEDDYEEDYEARGEDSVFDLDLDTPAPTKPMMTTRQQFHDVRKEKKVQQKEAKVKKAIIIEEKLSKKELRKKQIQEKKDKKRAAKKILGEGNTTSRPNHFVSIRMNHPSVMSFVKELQQRIKQKYPVFQYAMQESDSLHVTLNVIKIVSDEQRAAAIQVMKDFEEKDLPALFPEPFWPFAPPGWWPSSPRKYEESYSYEQVAFVNPGESDEVLAVTEKTVTESIVSSQDTLTKVKQVTTRTEAGSSITSVTTTTTSHVHSSRFFVPLGGLGQFGTAVLYAMIAEGPEYTKLCQIFEALKKRFEAAKLTLPDEERSYQPHITIFKLSKVSKRNKKTINSGLPGAFGTAYSFAKECAKQKRTVVESSSSTTENTSYLSPFQPVTTIELSSMMERGTDGYYKSIYQVRL